MLRQNGAKFGGSVDIVLELLRLNRSKEMEKLKFFLEQIKTILEAEKEMSSQEAKTFTSLCAKK